MFIVQCDSCDNDRPARLWKATTIHQPPSAEPVALGVYCSLECAQRAPSGSLAAARARLDFILKVEGRNAGTRLWQRLIDAYPQPVPVLDDAEICAVYRASGAPEDWLASRLL